MYIYTMGCQMNVYDSGQIQNRLALLDYAPTDDLDLADLIIVNTCSIRAKAEQKAFSFLGRLAPLKARKPELIVGIGGCVAQQEGKRILKRMPHIDLVFGTHAIRRLPRHIDRIAAERCRIVDVQIAESVEAEDFALGPFPLSEISAFVTIMRGCDNYCTYCVVPFVRGRESSRKPEEIIAEIEHLVKSGVREVTLLGQNVNSYGRKEGLDSFAQLLARIDQIRGLERVRFTTSHPKDLSEDLIAAFARLEKLCHHIHLPVQSGSDRILKRMNRHYTRERYLEKVGQLKAACPDIAISSDIIVGFPGEQDDDFQATLDLIRQVGFDSLFAFMYSDRPQAPARQFKGKIALEVKNQRLQEVLACQQEITQRRNAALIGTVQQVLVDGPSKNQSSITNGGNRPSASVPAQWAGRTTANKIVHFGGDGRRLPNQLLTGRLINIMIERAMPHCLWGRVK